MTMTTKTLVRLAPVGALCLLAACSSSPGNTAEQTSPPAVTAPSDPSDPPAETPSESVDPPASPSSEATSSEDPGATDELPPEIHGKWVAFKQGETPRECTEDLDNEGAILTIDGTRISSFAFLFDLESIEESNDDSIVGVFDYADDSDQPATPRMKLETTDDWQTFELIQLDTEGQDQELYARCS